MSFDKIDLVRQENSTMRWSQYFIPTLREDPADAEVVSHRLLLRAGIVRQLSAGIYSYLPLGQKIALKVMQILREEMNRIGGQEFYLPALQPAEIWKESGRWDAIGDDIGCAANHQFPRSFDASRAATPRKPS